VAVTDVPKLPDQFHDLLLGPYRIAHGHPASAFDPVHDESLSTLGEKEHLVPQQGKVGHGSPAGLHQGTDPLGPRRIRGHDLRPCRAKQPGDCNEQDQAEGTDRSPQEARSTAPVPRKSPPQIVGVLDVLVREEAQPKGA